MIEEKELQYFISILDNTVEYVKRAKTHYLGAWILTNKDMRIMCANHFGSKYDMLSGAEQRKIRERIFRALRGENDG